MARSKHHTARHAKRSRVCAEVTGWGFVPEEWLPRILARARPHAASPYDRSILRSIEYAIRTAKRAGFPITTEHHEGYPR